MNTIVILGCLWLIGWFVASLVVHATRKDKNDEKDD